MGIGTRLLSVLLLAMVIGGIQAHVSDWESFLNTVSLTDKNKDYDRDGATETTDHHVEIVKDTQIVFIATPVIRLIATASQIFSVKRRTFFLSPLNLQDFHPQIFRPPISA